MFEQRQTARGPWRKFLRLALLVVALLAMSGARLRAEDAPSLEQQVQAAFLAKFPAFIEWPAALTNLATNETFTIGILGRDPFGTSVDQSITNLQVKGRSIRLQRGTTLAELEGCLLIFIGDSESKRLDELLRQLEGKPVLTVAAEPDFARRGGMINFTKEGGRVRFEFNVAAAERAGLKLSAKLLQVGRIVARGRGGDEK